MNSVVEYTHTWLIMPLPVRPRVIYAQEGLVCSLARGFVEAVM